MTVPPLSAVVWNAAAPLKRTADVAGRRSSSPRTAGTRRRPRRDPRRGARGRLPPGHLRLAAGGYRRLDGPRHGRQRAVPRLPRRVRHRRRAPRSSTGHRRRPRRRPRRRGDLGRRRRACAAERWRRRRRRPGRAAGRVAVPGSHNSELGCVTDTGAPEDWAPWCDQAQLTRDVDDDVWKLPVPNPDVPGSPELPAGGYAFKAAINRTWDENYGAGGARNGSDIPFDRPAAAGDLLLRPPTHWVTNDVLDPIVTAPGSFQSELGCPATGRRTACGPGCRTRTATAPTPSPPRSSRRAPTRSRSAHGLSWDEN